MIRNLLSKHRSSRERTSGKMSKTSQAFEALMKESYQLANLKNCAPADFKNKLENLLATRDAKMEGYRDEAKQRDLSIQFHWGHNHDFGEFQLAGRMETRHLSIPAFFKDEFQALPDDLSGKKILDIGVWTGGTSLLLCALGAEVVAIEEVKKYVLAVEFLKNAFDIRNLTVINKSLYDLNTPEFFDRFDYILFSGVIYHVTDPVLAARIAFNALKDGGRCLVETAGVANKESMFSYAGPSILKTGTKEKLNRGGWNWFIPSEKALQTLLEDVGFENVQVKATMPRLFAVGTRRKHVDMNRAGLSVRTIR